jgi:hypothetical protein
VIRVSEGRFVFGITKFHMRTDVSGWVPGEGIFDWYR